LTVKRNWSSVQVRFVRGIFKADKLVSAAIKDYNTSKAGEDNIRFFVSRKQGR
jgi:hypothetical protein